MAVAPIALRAADDSDLPAGPEKDTFIRMCSNCHALQRVTKTRFPRKFWESTVDDMVSRGAEGSEEEANAVVSYLTRNFGKAVKINDATAKQLQANLSFSASLSESIIQYRTEHGPFKTLEDLLKVPGFSAKLLEDQKKNIVF